MQPDGLAVAVGACCWVLKGAVGRGPDVARSEAIRRCINNQISPFLFLPLSSVLVSVKISDLIQTHFMGHFTAYVE